MVTFRTERRGRPILVLVLATAATVLAKAPARAQEPVPNVLALTAMLQNEPISERTWPTWKKRLLDWSYEHQDETMPAFQEAFKFLRAQAKVPNGKLPKSFDKDAVAYMLLGASYLYDTSGEGIMVRSDYAKRSLEQSLKIDGNLARAHYFIGKAIYDYQTTNKDKGGPDKPDVGQLKHAREEFAKARQLRPKQKLLPLTEQANLDMWCGDWGSAEKVLQTAVQQEPTNQRAAQLLAQVVTSVQQYAGRSKVTAPLAERFPKDGVIAARNGYALALDGDPEAGADEFKRARKLGVEPGRVIDPRQVAQIEKAAEPSFFGTFLRWMMWFFIIYAIIIALMFLAGLLLASKTRGPKALDLLGSSDGVMVGEGGQVVRTSHESLLTRFYMIMLFMALILFYISIPFVVWGLLIVTLVVLVVGLFFRRDYASSQLHNKMLAATGGGLWAVMKSLFVGFSKGGRGLKKDEDDCPRLYQVLADVAKRVDTDPVDEVYIAPGSMIGVKQEGSGPFGLFGRKKRILTLGLSTMHFLTVSELKAILAHEYAHFSHQDTFYSRFIYQVSLSIAVAMDGMKEAGGFLTYFNPFYWFFWLYYKAYALLSSGFSRSREFLADRMACSLYGADVFANGLTKVCTDGTLFESYIYDKIAEMLKKDKEYVNMYVAFRKFRDEKLSAKERDKFYKKILAHEPSLFDSHPTFGERIDAVKALSKAKKTNSISALQVFEEPDEIEKEMTEIVTEVMKRIMRLNR